MYRRYSVHRDGDLLVEELDPTGKPIDPEPVPPEDRLPIEVILLSPDDRDARAALLDLLEMAHEMESESLPPAGGDTGGGPNVVGSGKLNVLK